MRRIYLPLLYCICLYSFKTIAQTNSFESVCSYDENQTIRLENDAAYRTSKATFEKLYRERVAHLQIFPWENQVPYNIPVVVHIIHNGTPLGTVGNPSDSAVAYLIQQTNLIFHHTYQGAPTFTNPNYGVDTDINFCLAKTDPNGFVSTGIMRYYDPINSIGTAAGVSVGAYQRAWDVTKYCNLFLIQNLSNSAYIGIIDISLIHSGSINPSLISHELGHYFSLEHTFSSVCDNSNCLTEGDFVCDTPPKASSILNGTCSVPGNDCTTDEDDTSTNNPYRPIALGGLGDQPDMVTNYMDYTNECWASFSQGQKVRMQANIDLNRVMLMNNTIACSPGLPFTIDAGIQSVNLQRVDNCQGTFTPKIVLKNYGTSSLDTVMIKVLVNNNVVLTQTWTGNLITGDTTTVVFSNPINVAIGSNTITIKLEDSNGMPDLNNQNDVYNKVVEYLGGTSCDLLTACSNFNLDTNLGYGNTTVINIPQTYSGPNAYVTQICVKVQGDVGDSGETFIITDESNFNRGLTNTYLDCNGFSPEFCFTVSAAEYENWTADGNITITLNPVSAAINPSQCTLNEACATIQLPLPIELSSWKGTSEKDGNHLTWTTLTETNNEYFNVQYAANLPTGFRAVGKVDGAGNSTSLNKYSFLHNATGQHHYYRLESVDFDGTKHLSKVIFLSSSVPKIVLAPNPVINNIVIKGDITAFGKVSYSIIDVAGKTLTTAILDRDRIDVSELPSGTYFLQIIGEWEMQSLRFIKLSN